MIVVWSDLRTRTLININQIVHGSRAGVAPAGTRLSSPAGMTSLPSLNPLFILLPPDDIHSTPRGQCWLSLIQVTTTVAAFFTRMWLYISSRSHHLGCPISVQDVLFVAPNSKVLEEVRCERREQTSSWESWAKCMHFSTATHSVRLKNSQK